jgi:death-on-curing protein
VSSDRPQPSRVDFLDLDDLYVVIERALGTRHAVRDAGLLEAAVARPRASLFGVDEVYPGLAGKAAALLHSLVTTHPLVDGNKRVGLTAMLLFYGLDGSRLEATDDQLFDLVMAVADGTLSEVAEIAGVLQPWERLR